MKINEIKGIMKDIEIICKVIEKTKPILRGGKNFAQVALEDNSGHIVLNLWREQVKNVNVGDVIMVKGAFTQRQYGLLSISTWSDIIVIKNGSH